VRQRIDKDHVSLIIDGDGQAGESYGEWMDVSGVKRGIKVDSWV
jgi:hypothetical protein